MLFVSGFQSDRMLPTKDPDGESSSDIGHPQLAGPSMVQQVDNAVQRKIQNRTKPSRQPVPVFPVSERTGVEIR